MGDQNGSKFVTIFGTKLPQLLVQNGCHFCSKMGSTLGPKWGPLWVQNGNHFGSQTGATLAPKWAPPKGALPTFSRLKNIFNPTLALSLPETALECHLDCFFNIFLHNLHFFLHPFRRPKLSHRLGSWTCPLYFEGAAVHRRRRLR